MITVEEVDRLLKCLELTRSDKDGEVLAAIAAANRMLSDRQTSWKGMFLWVCDQMVNEAMSRLASPTIDVMLARVIARIPEASKGNGMFRGFRDQWRAKGSLSDKQIHCLKSAYQRYCQ